MKLTVLGAAREVTGSSYLVETDAVRFLVDCGMFQGGRGADKKNREAFDFDPEQIDFVLLTHAHIDHSGLLPRLVALGFKGPIYTTAATADLLGVMLPDSAYIQEKESERENYKRHKTRKKRRREAAPLYTVVQAQDSLKKLRPVEYDQDVAPHDSVRCVFRDAGHILGSAIIEMWVSERQHTRKLVFSGDLGQPGHPVVRDPTPIEEADVLLVESTYGNRLHKSMQDTLDELVFAVNDTIVRKQGNLIIPAFTVGRTQDILYLLVDLSRQGKLKGNPQIYVDSPMALAATEITLRHLELLDADARKLMQWGNEGSGFPKISFVQDVEESIALNDIKSGAIIISASGMCDAGRIKYHLRNNLARWECSILITGFQAGGTLGRRLVDGARVVRIFDQDIPVHAKLFTVGGLSAHADQAALLGWLGHFRKPPQQTFVVHGEETVAVGFAELVREQLGWNVAVPELNSEFKLG
jgi:metallo-beta-lactamase family protein